MPSQSEFLRTIQSTLVRYDVLQYMESTLGMPVGVRLQTEVVQADPLLYLL